MGKLSTLAKTPRLKGPVTFVNAKGESRTFPDEAEAEKALANVDVEHRRGAFFERPAKAAEKTPAPKKPAAPPADKPDAPPASK